MSNSIAPGSSADVNVRVTALTTNPNVPVTYKTIILKKNLVNGVNTLTQEMMSTANTKYVIKYDYTLGENITVPTGCVLKFDGGSINGEFTITGTNTGINAGLVKIFNTDVTLAGTWNIAEAYPEWFGAKPNDNTVDNAVYINKAFTICYKVLLQDKTYYTSTTITLPGGKLCGNSGFSVVHSMFDGVIINPSAGQWARETVVESLAIVSDKSTFSHVIGINIYNTGGTIIKDVTITGCDKGINIDNSVNVVMSNLFVTGCAVGLEFNNGCYNNRLYSSTITSNDVAIKGAGAGQLYCFNIDIEYFSSFAVQKTAAGVNIIFFSCHIEHSHPAPDAENGVFAINGYGKLDIYSSAIMPNGRNLFYIANGVSCTGEHIKIESTTIGTDNSGTIVGVDLGGASLLVIDSIRATGSSYLALDISVFTNCDAKGSINVDYSTPFGGFRMVSDGIAPKDQNLIGRVIADNNKGTAFDKIPVMSGTGTSLDYGYSSLDDFLLIALNATKQTISVTANTPVEITPRGTGFIILRDKHYGHFGVYTWTVGAAGGNPSLTEIFKTAIWYDYTLSVNGDKLELTATTDAEYTLVTL